MSELMYWLAEMVGEVMDVKVGSDVLGVVAEIVLAFILAGILDLFCC